MREVKIQTGYLGHPSGSCLVSFGETRVICTATVEESVPPFLKGSGRGWLTAEYAMLPGSTPGGRKRREIGKRDGRSTEIQRLIGRSLRAAIDLEHIGEISIYIDCDVIQADGGTRTASISGGWVALFEALGTIREKYQLPDPDSVLTGQLAAVSVGVVDGEVICDLDYAHDSEAEVDMNIVKLDDRYVEVQGTGEKGVFDRERLNELLSSADEGIAEIFTAQKRAIAAL